MKVWEPRWASTGVPAVIRAHEAAEVSRTRSPPTLQSSKYYQKEILKLHTSPWNKQTVVFVEVKPCVLLWMNRLLVAGMSSQDLGETVAPEETAQDEAGVDFTPVESGCHRDSTDRRGHPSTVQEAGAQKQHHHPFLSQRSANHSILMICIIIWFRQAYMFFFIKQSNKMGSTSWENISTPLQGNTSKRRTDHYSWTNPWAI